MAKSAWRVDEAGRLLTPSGAFVARLEGGKLFFYNRKLGVEEVFTLADWWALMDGDGAGHERKGGAWGRRDGTKKSPGV